MADESKQAKGGLARAESTSPERRSEIARQGAYARWKYKATHKGNFKKDFGIDVDCYVLGDKGKTAAISQSEMGAAIGLERRGNSLPRFLSGDKIAPYVGAELREKLENPIIFQGLASAPGMPRPIVYGYDITHLIDICDAIIRADFEGKLLGRHFNVVRQANIIRTASAKLGIKQLAWAVAGYDPTKEDIINEFKRFVSEEASEYAREFPDELYEGWSKLYDLPLGHHCGNGFYLRSPKYMHLTNKHVYWTLAKSEGRVHQLLMDQRSDKEEWKKRLHQFLSDVGKKALRRHLGKLLGIIALSDDKNDYESKIDKVFGKPPS